MTVGRIPSVEGGIQPTLLDAKGDLIAASAADTPQRLAVGSNNQVLTADSSTATGLKWATPASTTPTFVGCVLTNSASQSTANNTFSTITFDTEKIDTDAFHSTVTNTNRITIPTGKSGKYLFTMTMGIASNATGIRYLYLTKNSTTPSSGATVSSIAAPAGLSASVAATGSVVLDLAAGDWVSMSLYQNSGGALNVLGDNQDPYTTSITATYLGA